MPKVVIRHFDTRACMHVATNKTPCWLRHYWLGHRLCSPQIVTACKWMKTCMHSHTPEDPMGLWGKRRLGIGPCTNTSETNPSFHLARKVPTRNQKFLRIKRLPKIRGQIQCWIQRTVFFRDTHRKQMYGLYSLLRLWSSTRPRSLSLLKGAVPNLVICVCVFFLFNFRRRKHIGWVSKNRRTWTSKASADPNARFKPKTCTGLGPTVPGLRSRICNVPRALEMSR